jgi:transcriptional regulator with XRE-family HTH domain
MNRRTHSGITLRRYRLRKDISQRDLAKALGLNSSQFISNIERGFSSYPVSYISRLARILGIRQEILVAAKARDVRDKIFKEVMLE